MVQEIRVTEDDYEKAVAFWGNTGMYFLSIAISATWGCDNSSSLRESNINSDGDELLSVVNTKDCATANQLMYTVERDLSWLLCKTAYREASDDRDRIFGLLNLVPSSQWPPFGPDYTRTTAEVFRDTIAHIILRSDQDLEILNQVALLQSHPAYQDQEWPTWVPVWSREEPDWVAKLMAERHGLPSYAACGDLRVQAELQDPSILSVKRISVGSIARIVSVSERRKGHHKNNAKDFQGAWELVRPHAHRSSSNKSLVHRLLVTMLCGQAEVLRTELGDPWAESLRSHFLVWAAARGVTLTPTSIPFEVIDSAALAATGLLEPPYDSANPEHAPYRVWWQATAKRAYPDTWRKVHAAVQRKATQRGITFDCITQTHLACCLMFLYPELGQADEGRFADAYCEQAVAMRFFITENDVLGMAPVWAEAGDLFTVLFGSGVPILLRPVQEGYLVEGSCCVQGAMHGELIQRLRDDRTLAERTKTFTLR